MVVICLKNSQKVKLDLASYSLMQVPLNVGGTSASAGGGLQLSQQDLQNLAQQLQQVQTQQLIQQLAQQIAQQAAAVNTQNTQQQGSTTPILTGTPQLVLAPLPQVNTDNTCNIR